MENSTKCNRAIIYWAIVLLCITILYCHITYFSFNKDANSCYLLSWLIITLCAVLAIFITSTVFFYKVFITQSKLKEKEMDYLHKTALEEIQRERYKNQDEKKIGEKELKEEISKVLKTIEKEQKETYNESLKSLKKNMKLYKEAKDIIEDKEQSQK